MRRRQYHRHSAQVIRSPRWRVLRLAAKRRDGWKCVECGCRGRLEVDHKKPVRSHPDLAYELSNLQTLCASCHSKKTRIEIGLDPMNEDRAAWRVLIRAISDNKPEVFLDA